MVQRSRIRSQRLKVRKPYLFPYKEELSVGKMEFTAAGDNDLHLAGDLRDAMGGRVWFINRRDIGLSGLYGLFFP